MKTLDQLEKKLNAKHPGFSLQVAEELERMEISDQLRAARKAAGMTQAEVAGRMHVNRSYVAQLESGPQNVKVSTLIKYTAALGKHMRLEVA